jgi:hypothetical protein
MVSGSARVERSWAKREKPGSGAPIFSAVSMPLETRWSTERFQLELAAGGRLVQRFSFCLR